jgi:hypothetical protein
MTSIDAPDEFPDPHDLELSATVYFPADSPGATMPSQISSTKQRSPLVVIVHGNSASLVKRAIEYIKDRTEDFDDYYPCVKNVICPMYVCQWMKLFMFMYNSLKSNLKFGTISGLIGGENS